VCSHAEIRVDVDTKIANNGGRGNSGCPHVKRNLWNLELPTTRDMKGSKADDRPNEETNRKSLFPADKTSHIKTVNRTLIVNNNNNNSADDF